jgi:Tol biopolymer transport system component
MKNRYKHSASSVIGGISLLTLATAFSACVPVEPPSVGNRLNFVTASDNGAGETLKYWSPATGQLTNIVTSLNNAGIAPFSGQPNGTGIMYGTGVLFGYQGVGGTYAIAENNEGQYVKRLLASSGTEPVQGPAWSPDGTHTAAIQNNSLYVALTNGIRTRVGPAKKFAWSPGSKKIIYSNPSSEAPTAHVYDIATAQDILVADSSYGIPASGIESLQWLTDNRHVIVTSFSSASDHIVVDVTAAVPAAFQQINTTNTGYSAITPSPTNDRFISATGSPYDHTRKYSVVYADGRAPVPLAGVLNTSYPSWSATGNHIYFVADVGADGILDAVVTDADGQTQQTFALPSSTGSDPTIFSSPKNDKLAFVRVIEAQYFNTVQLTVVDLPSGNIHSFDPVPADHTITASWSPNGRFLTWGTNFYNLFLYDSNASDSISKPLNIDQYGYGLSIGPWSPDSKYIAVCRGDAFHCLPAVIGVDSSTLSYTEVPGSTTQQLIWTGK